MPRLLNRLDTPEPLTRRMAPDSMTAGEHFCVSLGYVARTVLPLTGQTVPDLPCNPDPGVIMALSQDMRYLLNTVTRADFEGAAERTITHMAGEAEISQFGRDYATLYALPNAQSHLAFGYATLRMAGVQVGKGDLDGYHRYTPGTNFAAPTH